MECAFPSVFGFFLWMHCHTKFGSCKNETQTWENFNFLAQSLPRRKHARRCAQCMRIRLALSLTFSNCPDNSSSVFPLKVTHRKEYCRSYRGRKLS